MVTDQRPTCARCGTTSVTPAAPLTWVTSRERGRLLHYCERCARDHVRGIEAKLDGEWW